MARVSKTSGQVYFREMQAFRQPWLYIAVAVGGLMPIVVLYVLMTRKGSVNPEQFFLAVPIVLVISVLSIVILFNCSLETIVTSSGIYVKWRPFHRSFLFYNWADITGVKLTRTSIITPKMQMQQHKLVLKMSGNTAVELQLAEGKNVVIGTEKPSRMAGALSRHIQVVDQLNRKS